MQVLTHVYETFESFVNVCYPLTRQPVNPPTRKPANPLTLQPANPPTR
jgi:hypothetical protein